MIVFFTSLGKISNIVGTGNMSLNGVSTLTSAQYIVVGGAYTNLCSAQSKKLSTYINAYLNIRNEFITLFEKKVVNSLIGFIKKKALLGLDQWKDPVVQRLNRRND